MDYVGRTLLKIDLGYRIGDLVFVYPFFHRISMCFTKNTANLGSVVTKALFYTQIRLVLGYNGTKTKMYTQTTQEREHSALLRKRRTV